MQSFLFFVFPQILNVKVVLKSSQNLVISNILSIFAPRKSNNIMILQEKIQKKAEGFGKLAPAFLEGAEYALNNQWISVEDDLPCNHEKLIFKHSGVLMTRLVFVLYSDYSFRIIKMYKFGDKWLWEYNTIPSYWMYLPELPKE